MLIGINLKLPRWVGTGQYSEYSPWLLLEDGDAILLEDLYHVLLENKDTISVNLHAEDGYNLLLEDSDYLLLET
jgi:hypothetical protein